jgi:hypothetical protein
MSDLFELTVKSYRDTFELLSKASGVLIAALIILAVGDIAGLFAARLFTTALGKTLISTLATVAALWFAAPYLVKLLRMLLADQLRPGLESFDGPATNMRFFAWSSVFAFLAAVPQYAYMLTPPITTPTIEDADVMALFWLTFFLLVALWIFTARTVTILPAVALGRDISLREAFAHTARRFWFVVFAVFLPVVPLTLIGRIFVAGTEGSVFIVLSVIVSVATEALALVVSANIYRWLMDHRQ